MFELSVRYVVVKGRWQAGRNWLLRVEKTHSSISKTDIRGHVVANVGSATCTGRTFLIGHRRLRPMNRRPT
jgi:hypothetical protein